MATAATQAVPLPSRLIRFFMRYPPQKYSAFATGQSIPTMKERLGIINPNISSNTPRSQQTAEATSDSEPIHTLSTVAKDPVTTESASSSLSVSTLPTTTVMTSKKQTKPLANPFLPWKNPATGRWRGAKMGLRIQADLFKIAREYGVEELLPASIKSSEFKQRRALERGLQVKGTGEGQKVKGHKWERQIGATMEKRRKAMEEMPELIRQWKQRGHGRGWRKYPK